MPNEARVLIIEDNNALRVMLFTVLRHQPLGVDTAATAEEALEKVSQCDYALILMDANLPNDASAEFVRRFREERPEATSFIIAVRDPNIDVTIDANVVSAILNKPLEIDTLAEVVRECAVVVPPPDDPLPCPPAESDVRSQMDRGSTYWSN
ncbi:MAG TPA: response regulator [Thermoanaerobaculia bacterium]|nr:response regulator [Thermoanaerobaculia bacterium]